MSDDANNHPFGSPLLEQLRWKPPAPKVVSEEERKAIQARLEGFLPFATAMGREYDIAEEMARRNLRTNDQVAQEQAAAEAAKAAADARAKVAKTWAENDKRERQEQLEADDQRLADDVARSIGKSVKRAVKRTLKGG